MAATKNLGPLERMPEDDLADFFEGQTAELAAAYLLAMKLQADPVTGELPCKLLPVGSAFFLPANPWPIARSTRWKGGGNP